jgi:hypothetical protein
MRILYVAKHESGDNDDEGAIYHALTELGHEVDRIREVRGHRAPMLADRADFVLFHKWEDTPTMRAIKKPKVFWYFDLVRYPDETLAGRNNLRATWMENVTKVVDLGFCTDGDWVNQDTTGKLIRLTQGADTRVAGLGEQHVCPLCNGSWSAGTPVCFTGTRTGGRQRSSCVADLEARYGERFKIITGVHGRQLANLIRNAQIMVAPDGPATDHYWSNRVYLTLGFGGFLLHPYCQTLTEQYTDGKEIILYRGRQDLFDKIDHYLTRPEEREWIRAAALKRTLAEHTYTHRCRTLIETVQRRLGL